MFCPKCAQTLRDGDRFCAHCGAAVTELQPGVTIAPATTATGTLHTQPLAHGLAAFQWKWVAIAIPVILVLQFLLGMTAVALTGGGPVSILVSSVVSFFTGGFLIAFWSPGITIREPAVGIAVAVVAANLILIKTPASIEVALIGWLLPYFLGLTGARLGEALQARRKKADRNGRNDLERAA